MSEELKLTKSEAVKMLTDIHEGWSRWTEPNGSRAFKQLIALGMSIAALQEKLAKERECDWCDGYACDLAHGNGFSADVVDGVLTVYFEDKESIGRKINFCPMCGRKLGSGGHD